jgi:hypothetical protein
MAHQIYAKIKKSSKYYYQNDFAKERGEFPFPIVIDGHPESYCVVADIGEFRLRDVSMVLIFEGKEYKLN